MNGVPTMRWPSSRARGDFNGGELPRYNGWLRNSQGIAHSLWNESP